MRSRTILLLALIMGVITTVLFFNYTKETKTAATVQEETVQVVRAKEAIAENQIIHADVLEVVDVPNINVHPQTVKDISDIEGKYASATIEKGEILLAHQFKDQKEEATFISKKIKEGYRAVSIEIPFEQSVSNLVEPGDLVDIVSNKTVNVNGKDQVISEQIYSHVPVLAVGRKMKASDNEQDTYVEYSTITLEMKPEDTVELIQASENGTIHFTLNPSVFSNAEEK